VHYNITWAGDANAPLNMLLKALFIIEGRKLSRLLVEA
jgi:hypothetical protein